SALSVAKRSLLEEWLRGPIKVSAEENTIRSRSKQDVIPLSFAQQRLWFLDQLAPNNPFYNLPGAVRLEGGQSLQVMERVIHEIIKIDEGLRTRFEAGEAGPVQVIDEWKPRRLEVIDLTGWTREEREVAASKITREEIGTGFDLSRGPLLRVKVLKLEEE